MIQYSGKNYVLKYNMKRIEMIEAVTSMPTLADLKRTGGMLSLASLKAYIAYGIKEEGKDTFLTYKEGVKIAEALIEQNAHHRVVLLAVPARWQGANGSAHASS